MQKNRTLLFVFAFAAVCLTDSFAQVSNQFAVKKPYFNEVKPYVGGYIGGAWDRSNFNTQAGTVTSTAYFNQADINSVNSSGSNSVNSNTLIGGGRIGLDRMVRRTVYGLLLDIGSFHFKKVNNASNIPYSDFLASYSLQTALTTDYLFTAQGRLGWTPTNNNNFLLYTTGGLALTTLRVSNTFSDTAPGLGIGGTSQSKTKAGFSVGGGIEVPVTTHLTLYSEYLFVNFRSISASSSVNCSVDFCAGIYSSPLSTAVDLTANLFKAGFNYKFL